jgi:CRP-like cAMP-binding protein
MEAIAFFKLLESCHPQGKPLSEKLKEELKAMMTERTCRKRQLLLHEDHVPEHAWFLAKGTARVYYYDQQTKKEITSWFWYQGELIFPLKRFISEKENGDNIQLFEDSVLLSLPAGRLIELASGDTDYCLIQGALLDSYKSRLYERSRDLVCLDSQRRYHKFWLAHKKMFNMANLSEIGSFLNIHHKTLSKLRSENSGLFK